MQGLNVPVFSSSFSLIGFLGIMSSSCDMLEHMFSSLFDKVNVIVVFFGVSLSNDGSDLFYL